ncbi:MAG: FAD-dependent oxidoreductase [Rhodospirillales bacterium]|nr:FAD-dependent oxidoreductase [Rhodospirillales bacterium]
MAMSTDSGANLLPPELADDTNDKHYVAAPCQIACPVGTDAPSYIGYIWEGKFDEAFEAITATNPFSSICGRVCDAPCEPACRRAASDGPLQIRNLKRFVMDKLGVSWKPEVAPVTREQSVGIVGAGPAGLVAAHDLAVAGFKIDVYEMTDKAGGMMIWGIPAFRLPPGIINEDMGRLVARCPGLTIHTNTALGRDVTLQQLKERHDAVCLTIGSWWGKKMGIPGEDDARVIDGVEFLRRVNDGERPQMPREVVVIGGGDVAMDACRAALRLPGCEHVKVVYRRGPDEIPARKIELEGAIEEGIEFVYNTQQVEIIDAGDDSLKLRCVKTGLGEPDEEGRRRPEPIAGSVHDIDCGMVIAAVGQFSACDDVETGTLMGSDRVNTSWETMRTDDPKVFAAGDGAFGGSTIVMAMSHGQRLAYYVKSFLEGNEVPVSYRTPWRTRRVPVAQDLNWEKFGLHHPPFHGVGENPIEFPEIESTYTWEEARNEAARCYRCDAETGSADYSVKNREDIFLMARMDRTDVARQAKMLAKRLRPRENPFPEQRPATVDDLVFLPANLSRLVIDPYREACKVATDLGFGRMEIAQPFFATGFDNAPADVKAGIAKGLEAGAAGYIGVQPIGDNVPWLQLVIPGQIASDAEAAGLIHVVGPRFAAPGDIRRHHDDQLLGLSVSHAEALEKAIVFGLDNGFDVLLLNGSAAVGRDWPELAGPPDLSLMRDAIRILRRLNKEEEIDLLWFGGIRSGTDAAKLIGMGSKSLVFGMTVAFVAGGEIIGDHALVFAPDLSEDERGHAVANILKSALGEASMMARCTGKTNLHNLEPEDMRALTLATAEATDIVLAGKH